MITDLSELYACAALADWMYARHAMDHAIQLGDVKQDLILQSVEDGIEATLEIAGRAPAC